MKRVIWLGALVTAIAMTSAQAQLPPDAVKLGRVKISEKIGTANFCPVHKEYAETPVSTWDHAGVAYGGNTAECASLFANDAEAFHAGAERARWELNFVHSMSPIWCPVTDEISPGGNTKWDVIGLEWESCCQFCNDTKMDEDFPRALKNLQKRAEKAFNLQGAKYVEGASSPVAGAIDLGNGFPDDEETSKPEFVPAWVQEADLKATWSGGIGLIMENRCSGCHRVGGAAPMAMQTYGQVRKWSKNLKTHIVAGTMPPWPGKPGMSFANGKNLTTIERDLMIAWIDGGYATGEGEYKSSKEIGEWAISTPDAIIALPEYTLGENTAEEVKEFSIKTDFDSDKWVVATEVRPTDSFLTLEIDGGALGSYHRGNSTTFLPEGTGYLLKKGATVTVRIFYTKEAGWEEFDTDTKFALKFGSASKAIQQERMANDDFVIPAGEEKASASATFTFAEDAHIVSFNPVLRQRGKSVTITAMVPGGEEEELVAIPYWDINWHFNYTLVEPFAAPKGTVVTITATYDNSELNVQNPDATVDVKAGPGGDLLEGWVSYTLDNEKSAANRFGLTDEQLMVATGTCAKCEAAGKTVSTD